MEGNDAEDEAKLHLLVSLICTVVMVNYQGNSLRFLAGNRNKFLGDAKEIDQCLAYLLILERTVGENRGNSALQPKVDLYTLFT